MAHIYRMKMEDLASFLSVLHYGYPELMYAACSKNTALLYAYIPDWKTTLLWQIYLLEKIVEILKIKKSATINSLAI